MASITLSPSLTSEYQNLFDTCQVNAGTAPLVENIATKIEKNKQRYASVGGDQIPWYFIGIIHSLEAIPPLSFERHLHNGDPLTARTVQVPAGRPKTGSPPFTWEESALDALEIEGFFKWTNWTIPGMLFKFESYNGFGYRNKHPEVLSPYLWSFSNHYKKGKFVKDKVFSPTAVSKQCGAATILRRLAEKQAISFDKTGTPALGNTAATSAPDIGKLPPLVKFAPKTFSQAAADLQAALNKFPGIFLKVDGFAGKKTSDAVKRLTGSFLAGDPRA